MPPFLKSTRPPVRSKTTCENEGSWPTTSTRASSPWACSSSSASSRSKPLASDGVLHGLDVERAAGQLSRVARADLRARVARRELDPEPGEACAGGDAPGARRARSARARRRAWSREGRPLRGGEARAAAPSHGHAYRHRRAPPSASTPAPDRGRRRGARPRRRPAHPRSASWCGPSRASGPRRCRLSIGSIRRSPKRERRTTTISSSQPPSLGQVSTTRPTSSPWQSWTCSPRRVTRRISHLSPGVAPRLTGSRPH